MSDNRTPNPPDFLSIDEVARILRVGRTSAYETAHQWEATGRGLHIIRIGRQMRVTRTSVEAMLGRPDHVAENRRPAAHAALDRPVTTARRRGRVRSGDVRVLEHLQASAHLHRRVHAACGVL